MIRTVITAIHVTPSVREWTLEIKWINGARTWHQLLTPRGTRELITQAFRNGHSCCEIADLLDASAAEVVPPALLAASRSAKATLRKLRPVLQQLQAQNPATPASADGASEATSA